MITIDLELNEKLKTEKNASDLIRNLLIKHYEQEKLKDLSDEELEKMLEVIKIEKDHKEKMDKIHDETKKKIEEVKNGNERTSHI